MSNLIVIDADLPKRLAGELKSRGRPAVSLSELNLHRSLDPVVISRLRDRFDAEPFVLVTGDDHMPLEHAEHLAGMTIGVVDPTYPVEFTMDQWRRETVHRWAGSLVTQQEATWIRYGVRRAAWLHPRRIRRTCRDHA